MKLAILGAAGRMGRLVARCVFEDPSLSLTGACVASGRPECGDDIATLTGGPPSEVRVTDKLDKALSGADAIIDFSTPQAVQETLEFLRKTHERDQRQPAYICGVTGLRQEGYDHLEKLAGERAVVHAHNFSPGVNLLIELVENIAHRLDKGWDIDILDHHHRMKKDAPSGTALSLGQAVARGRGEQFDPLTQWKPGDMETRPEGHLCFSVLRSGGVIGDHEIRFSSLQETLTLKHQAHDRSVFAKGALRAAKWAFSRPPGLYTMRDVLGER